MHEASRQRATLSEPSVIVSSAEDYIQQALSTRKWRSSSLPPKSIVTRPQARNRAPSPRPRTVSFSEPLEIDAFGNPVHPTNTNNDTEAPLTVQQSNSMSVRTTSEGSFDGITLTLPKHNINEAENYYPRWQMEPSSNRTTTSNISHLSQSHLGMPPTELTAPHHTLDTPNPYGPGARQSMTSSDRFAPDSPSRATRPTPSPSTESTSANPYLARRTTQMSSTTSSIPHPAGSRTSHLSSSATDPSAPIQMLPPMQHQTPAVTASRNSSTAAGMSSLLPSDYEPSALHSPRTVMPLRGTASDTASSYRSTSSHSHESASLASSQSAASARSQIAPSGASNANSNTYSEAAHAKAVQRRTTDISNVSSSQYYIGGTVASHTHDQVYYAHHPEHNRDEVLSVPPVEQQSLRTSTHSTTINNNIAPASPRSTYTRDHTATSIASYDRGDSPNRTLSTNIRSSLDSEAGGVPVYPARLTDSNGGSTYSHEDDQLLSAVHIAANPAPEPFLTPANSSGRIRTNTPAPSTFTSQPRSNMSRVTAPELSVQPRYGEPELATRLEAVVSAPTRVRSRSTAPSNGLNNILGRIKNPTADDLTYNSTSDLSPSKDNGLVSMLSSQPGSPFTPIQAVTRPSTTLSSASSTPGSVPLPGPGATGADSTISSLHSSRTTAQSNFGFARADEAFSLPGGLTTPTRPSATSDGNRHGALGSLPASQRPSGVSGGGGVPWGGPVVDRDPLLADAAALEEDLAAVMKRLPASLRYGARETGADLVSTGLLQQLYNRLSRLQAMLKQREVDAQKTSRQLVELKTKLSDSQAHETQLESHLMVVSQQLASKEQELLDVEQRLRDAERKGIEQAQSVAVQYSTRSLGGTDDASASVAELEALRVALETAKATLTKRDEELALVHQKLAQRDYELREADRVLRASEREMASQLQTAAGRLLPGLAARESRTESWDVSDTTSPRSANAMSATGSAQDVTAYSNKIRELELQVFDLQAALAAATATSATTTNFTRLESTADKTTAPAAHPRTSSIDAATVTKALEVELESLTRELQMHQATMDMLRADTEIAKQAAHAEREARQELELLVERLRNESSKTITSTTTTTSTTATDVNSSKESHVNVFVSEKGVAHKWDNAEAFAQEAKYLLSNDANHLAYDSANQTAIVAMADMAWGAAGIPVSLANQWRKALAQERGERQELMGRLEVASAELATTKQQISRLHTAHNSELSDAAHRVQQLEKQVKDLQARLESTIARLHELSEEFRTARQTHAATADELSLERDACRRLRLQVSVTQGSIDVLQKALNSAREDLAQAREQQLADALAAQTLSRQVEELGAEAAARLYAAEDAADRLARAQLERLLELRSHPYMEKGLFSFAMVPATPPNNVNPNILEHQLLQDGRTSRRSLAAVLGGPEAEGLPAAGQDNNQAPPAVADLTGATGPGVHGSLSPMTSSRGAPTSVHASALSSRHITAASTASTALPSLPTTPSPEPARENPLRALDLSPDVEWHTGLEVLERHLQLASMEAPPSDTPSHVVSGLGLEAPHHYMAGSSRTSSITEPAASGPKGVSHPSRVEQSFGTPGSARSSRGPSTGGVPSAARSPMPSLGGSIPIPASALTTPAPSIGSGIHGSVQGDSRTSSIGGAAIPRQSIASSTTDYYRPVDLSPRHTAMSSLGAGSTTGSASPRNTSLMFIGGGAPSDSVRASARNTATWSAGTGSIASANPVQADAGPGTPSRRATNDLSALTSSPASRSSPADSIRSAANALAAAAVGAGAAAAAVDNSRRASLAAQADAAMSAIRKLSEARASRASAATSVSSSGKSAHSGSSSGTSKALSTSSLSFHSRTPSTFDPTSIEPSPTAHSTRDSPASSYVIRSTRPSAGAPILPVRPHTQGGALPATTIGSLAMSYPRSGSVPGAFDPADVATALHVMKPVLGGPGVAKAQSRQSPIPSVVDAGDELVTQHATQHPSMVGRLQQSLQGLIDVSGDEALFKARFGSGGGYKPSV